MLVVANWKAYVEKKSTATALFSLAKRLSSTPLRRGIRPTLVLAPPAPYLGLLSAGNKSKVRFACQDLSIQESGAHTGEISAELLHELGVSYAIVGHSERRAAGETDTLIAQKAARALTQGIAPVLCIGEQERDADATYLHILRAQISAVYEALPEESRAQVILAYEPVWAIGKSAAEAITPDDLTEMVLYLRKVAGSYANAASVTILYGGSVDPSNIRTLSSCGIDGFLVGRASAEAASFTALIKALT